MGAETFRRAAPIVASLAAVALAFSPSSAAAPNPSSEATITATFADGCRDFAAHSNKDISHVEVRFADGRVVKDETATAPDYAIDGVAGEEIVSAVVKSGTAIQTFPCAQASTAPTAYLEIKTHDNCALTGFGSPPYTLCYASFERSVWLRPSGVSEGHIQVGVDGEADLVPQLTWSFRGTGSADPDGDITNWSIDFGDGTPIVGGTWTTQAPTEISHEFELPGVPTVTLTVTDAAGHGDSDTLTIHFFDATPD